MTQSKKLDQTKFLNYVTNDTKKFKNVSRLENMAIN